VHLYTTLHYDTSSVLFTLVET